MSFRSAKAFLEEYIQTRFPDYPLKFENSRFEVGESDNFYMAIFIEEPDGDKRELNRNGAFRYQGLLTVQMFERENTGVGESTSAYDLFSSAFRMKRFSETSFGYIRFRVPDRIVVGALNGWHQTNVKCTYERDKSEIYDQPDLIE